MFLGKFGVKTARLKAVFKKGASLSNYFPEGTQFYYGYPAGEDSGFLNKVTPAVEELVAARANSCAGKHVSVINFAATTSQVVPFQILNDFAVPQISAKQSIILPKEIDLSLEGEKRNKAVKKALKKQIKPGFLVMAQPYTDSDLANLYQIPAETTAWLNDKSNMSSYINADMLPKRYQVFASGAEFYGAYETLPLPAVVKASLSSSGDGVCLCFTKEDMKEAAEKFVHLKGNILVEQYIKVVTNYGVHFGIPHNKKAKISIIGVNEQLTTEKGEFIGGIIRSSIIPRELQKAVKHLEYDILPKVREKGWYGIGGFDVLVDEDGNPYFIDSNFRMTGMSAYHFLLANKVLERPIAAFSGQFVGSAEELQEKLYSYASKHANDKFLQLITISKHEDTWRFNGTISFITQEDLRERAKLILEAGVTSQALSFLAF